MNPSWVIQGMVMILIAMSGYFIDKNLSAIEAELQLSRIERAQLRSDMSALEIGLRGDRFTRTDWVEVQKQIDKELEEIKARLRALEKVK